MVQQNDLLCSYEFNSASAAGTYSKEANRYWWRQCIGVKSKPVTLSDGKPYYAIYVSDLDGKKDAGSDAPKAGDKFMVLGSKAEATTDDDKEAVASRKNAIVICAHEGLDSGLTAPYIAQYTGINDFKLAAFRESWWGYNAQRQADNHFVGNFSVSSNGRTMPVPYDAGEWKSGTTYYYYDRVSHNGSLWLMTTKDSNGTTEEPTASSGAWTQQFSKGREGGHGQRTATDNHYGSDGDTQLHRQRDPHGHCNARYGGRDIDVSRPVLVLDAGFGHGGL